MSSSAPPACGGSAVPGRSSWTCRRARPSLARRLAAECARARCPRRAGQRWAARCEDASLTIMVGGNGGRLPAGAAAFEALGRLVVLVGGHGAGQAAKLCNNLIAGATMAAIAESCAIAAGGASTRGALRASDRSTGDSRVLRTRFPLRGADDAHPASQGFAPLFALDLIAKDLGARARARRRAQRGAPSQRRRSTPTARRSTTGPARSTTRPSTGAAAAEAED